MQLPKITIVTPSFNQSEFLEQSINSVLSQNYLNLEYIIIDGGSTDNSVNIIKKYSRYLKYWVSENDNGQCDAINKGLQHSTGSIFNWLNSDDYFEVGSLHSIADEFCKQPDKKIICGYTHCFFEESKKTSHTYRMGTRATVAETIMNVEMNQPGSFYKINILRELGYLNTSLRYVFDSELWFRFLTKYGLNAVGYTDSLIAHFRLHEKSKSSGDGYFEFYKELLNVQLFLANEMKLFPAIIRYLENDQYIKRYVPGDPWDYHFLEKEIFEKILSEKYKFLLYKDRHYSKARKGLSYYLKYPRYEQAMLNLQLAIKLMFPDSLIDLMRTMKSNAFQ